jgi:hypothetical protein
MRRVRIPHPPDAPPAPPAPHKSPEQPARAELTPAEIHAAQRSATLTTAQSHARGTQLDHS